MSWARTHSGNAQGKCGVLATRPHSGTRKAEAVSWPRADSGTAGQRQRLTSQAGQQRQQARGQARPEHRQQRPAGAESWPVHKNPEVIRAIVLEDSPCLLHGLCSSEGRPGSPRGKGTVLGSGSAKAVSAKAVGTHLQRRCLSRAGGGDTRQRRCLSHQATRQRHSTVPLPLCLTRSPAQPAPADRLGSPAALRGSR